MFLGVSELASLGLDQGREIIRSGVNETWYGFS